MQDEQHSKHFFPFDIAEVSGLSDLRVCTGAKKSLGIQIIPFSVMVYKLYSLKCGKL